ncbi:MAG: hypothetical protein ABL958_10280 [Bdellovibrionia bacterium]
MKTQLLLALLVATSLIGCGKAKDDGDDNSQFSEAGHSLEGTINALSSISDDASDASVSSFSTASASAASSFCQRPASQACVASGANGVRAISYSGCVIPYSVITATGDAALTFNSNTCSLANTGDQVNRTYDVTFEGYYGATLRVSSESHQNYEGNTLGGGGLLTKTATGWEISVLGQHRVFKTRRGREVGNVSIRTVQPSIVTGTLTKVNRTVNSGQLEVAHNIAKVTATYTPSNLHWEASCCYPISGSLNVTLRGNDTRSADIAITGCGTAKITYNDGTVEDHTFRYCE